MTLGCGHVCRLLGGGGLSPSRGPGGALKRQRHGSAPSTMWSTTVLKLWCSRYAKALFVALMRGHVRADAPSKLATGARVGGYMLDDAIGCGRSWPGMLCQ